jgi:AP-4 complex subunit beta-1
VVTAQDYKAFYCRVTDPGYLKMKKLDILVNIANADNYIRITEELAAYVTDIDVEMARRAVNCVGQIAIKISESTSHCLVIVSCRDPARLAPFADAE